MFSGVEIIERMPRTEAELVAKIQALEGAHRLTMAPYYQALLHMRQIDPGPRYVQREGGDGQGIFGNLFGGGILG